jgi:eukaryotic-like serine/threonine-protein kinase
MIAQPGQSVGAFTLRSKIAEGGMGSVWVADDATGRKVAIKLLAKQPVPDSGCLERFSLEAKVAARIHNIHIPEVLARGVTRDGAPFLAMELLEGKDLQSYVAHSGPLSLVDVARLIEQLATALTAVHATGVVHRDVKPTNIIIGEPRQPGDRFHAYLIDFGIAKATGAFSATHVTHPGTTIGTPSYMSPEQLMGTGKIDARADVWSLAIVAYWCLTGKLPFTGESFRDVCIAIYVGAFTAVTELRPDLPTELDAWFDEALAGRASQRFDSVAIMSRMFQQATRHPRERASLSRSSEPAGDVESTALPAIRSTLASVVATRRGRWATLLSAASGSALGAAIAYHAMTAHASQVAGTRLSSPQPETQESAAIGPTARGSLSSTREAHTRATPHLRSHD